MSVSSADVELVALRDHGKEKDIAEYAFDKVISEDNVATDYGTVHVIAQGTANKPAIITYHDIGLNSHTNFHAFFNYSEMQKLLNYFCIYHINAPGQEGNCRRFPETYTYPNLDTLSEMITGVMKYYHIKSFIGLGVGAGANILTRYALSYPKDVNALCLVNTSSTVCGWSEWGYQKMNLWSLKTAGARSVSESVVDYLTWYHFGSDPPEHSNDVMRVYRENFEKSINPLNLAYYIESYVKRTDLGLVRSLHPDNGSKNLSCPVLLITSTRSPAVYDVEHMFTRINPQRANILKLTECSGAVLEEEPGKVSESLRLFLQGEGYIPCLTQYKPAYSRTSSHDGSSEGTDQVFHVKV